MDGDILGRRAFSLIEASLVLAIAAILLAITLYSAKGIRQASLADRVTMELDSVAIASTRYYSEKGVWPALLSDLRTSGNLASGSGNLNPFGNAYVITGGNQTVSVSTLLPKGLITAKSMGSEVVVVRAGNNDLVTITKLIETTIWGLKYEKKYTYHQ